jgi:hypothetical protein
MGEGDLYHAINKLYKRRRSKTEKMNENTALTQIVKELQSSNLSQDLILDTVDNYNFTLASAAARENTTDVPVFLERLISIALDLKKQLGALVRLNLASVNNTSSLAPNTELVANNTELVANNTELVANNTNTSSLAPNTELVANNTNTSSLAPNAELVVNNTELVANNTSDVPVFLERLISIASDLKKQLGALVRLNSPSRTNTLVAANTNSPSRTNTSVAANTNSPVAGFGNIQLPDLSSITKGLMLNAIPTSLIKSYVGGIQKLVDEVSKIRIDKSTIEGIIQPLNLLSSAIDGIANINLTKAMIGLVKFKIFNKVLNIAFKGAASPENLKAAKNLKRVSAALTPLESIGESLTAFASIKWVKTLLSVKALKLFLGSLSKLPIEIIKKFTDVIKKIASGIVKPMKSISDSLGYFGEKLGKVSGAIIKGAFGILLLSASMIPLAYSLKLFKDIDLKTIAVAGAALGGLALAASVLGKNMGMVLKGALAIAVLGASIIPLAYSLKMLQGVKWETLGIVAAAITGLGIAAAVIGSAAPLIATGAVVIALLGASLIPLAYSLKKISEIDSDVLGPIGKAIGDLGMGLLKGAAGLALGGLAMIPFSVGVLALGAATGLVGDGIGNFMEKFTTFSNALDPAKIFDSAKAISALALALAAFGAGDALAGLGQFVGNLLRFGSDSPLEQLQKFAAIGGGLAAAGAGVLSLSKGIAALAGLGDEIEALDNFPIDKIEKIAKATSTDKFSKMSDEEKASAAGYKSYDEYEKANFAWKEKDDIRFSKMSKEEKASAAGYKSYDEYEKAKFAWKEKDNIQTVPPSTGNTLATAGNVAATATTVVVNNNSGGNVSNVSSSNVNNNASPMMPLFTGTALGY